MPQGQFADFAKGFISLSQSVNTLILHAGLGWYDRPSVLYSLNPYTLVAEAD